MAIPRVEPSKTRIFGVPVHTSTVVLLAVLGYKQDA